jgi:dCMP deaminase
MKWDTRFLEVAKLVSSWSKDPSTQTGAVIVNPKNRVISMGYNGLPQGVEDLPERLNNRELKYRLIVHCERNAIIFAQRDLTGCTLYTHPFMSCSTCASMVIQAGIKRCVAPRSNNPRWIASFAETEQLYLEAGVELALYDVEGCE